MKNLKYFVMCNLLVTAILLISSKGFSVTYCVPGTSGGYSTYPVGFVMDGKLRYFQFSPNFSQNKAEFTEEDSDGNLTSKSEFEIEIVKGSLSCFETTVSVLIKVKVPGDDGSSYVALYKTSENDWLNAIMWAGNCYARQQFWPHSLSKVECKY